MISKKSNSSSKSLSQCHADLISLADWHDSNKTSHQFLKYVFSALIEDLPIDSEAALLLDHLITSYIADNECFLDEAGILINRCLKNIREVKS